MATEYSIDGGVISVTANSGNSNTTEWVHDGQTERSADSVLTMEEYASAFAEAAAEHATAASESADQAAQQATAASGYAGSAGDLYSDVQGYAAGAISSMGGYVTATGANAEQAAAHEAAASAYASNCSASEAAISGYAAEVASDRAAVETIAATFGNIDDIADIATNYQYLMSGAVYQTGDQIVDGVKTFTSAVKVKPGDGGIVTTNNSSYVQLCGGEGSQNSQGASVTAYGAAHASAPGHFLLRAAGSGGAVLLEGSPDGTLTWGGSAFTVGGGSGVISGAMASAASAGNASSLGGIAASQYAKVSGTADLTVSRANPYLNLVETDVTRGSGPDSGATAYQGVRYFDKTGSALIGEAVARCYPNDDQMWLRAVSPDGQSEAVLKVICSNSSGYAQITAGGSSSTVATQAYVAGATVTSAGHATSAGSATSAGTAGNATSLGGSAASEYVTRGGTQTISGAKTFSESPSIERANPYLNIVETDVQRGSATTGFQGFVFKDKNKDDLGGIYFQVSVSSSKPYGYIVLRHEGNAATANTHEIVYRQATDGTWYFMPNGKTDINLGASGNNRWKEVWSVAGSINTSDERLKDNIDAVPDYVLDAWGDVQWSQFQMRDAIAEKGAAFARLHNGLIAQRIDAAFTAHGLDASRYGLFCHDAWEADGEREAGDEYSLRYTEALAMEAAYQRRRAARAEARISALEERLAAVEAELGSY